MTSIAAIVCGHTLDRWGDIQQAISSLEKQTHRADQIILSVDNNVDLYQAARQEFPGITVVHNEGRRGVSPARNTAARVTDCDVLAYLDDDATADEHWIERLLGWYDDPNVVGVGGTANPAWDGDPAGPTWFPASFNWVVGCSHSGIGAEPAPVRNFIGCNMSIRRSAWQAVGGFDDSLGRVGADGAGGDETDFCIRVVEAVGGTIMNDPAAIVAHRVPESRQNLKYFLKRCRSEGRSKAQIAAAAGTDRALAEERRHLQRELPLSFFRGLGDALRGDAGGLGRAGAIALGTATTIWGYLLGKLAPKKPTTAEREMDFEPIAVLNVDLDVDFNNVHTVTGQPLQPAQPGFVIARRGARLLGTSRFDALPEAAELGTALASTYPPMDAVRRDERTSAPSATVVVATRDRPDQLQDCLDSLTAMAHRPDHIVVVDNAPSNDDTRLVVERWSTSTEIAVSYVRCDKPGLANAHNAALPVVTTAIVAFTDDDVLVDVHWLAEIIAGFDADDRVVCVSGAIMPAELETWAQDWVERSSNFTKGFVPKTFSMASSHDDPLFPFTAGSMGSGANMAFRSAWLAANKGFDGALGAGTTALGGDDLRAFYDVIDSGNSVHFNPNAIVFHHHHRTVEAIERQAYGYGAGLTAFLTSVALKDPRAVFAMVRRARRGARRAAEVSSGGAREFPGNKRRARRQRMGMASGPVRYLRSRA